MSDLHKLRPDSLALHDPGVEKWIITCLRSQYDAEALTEARWIPQSAGFDWAGCLQVVENQSLAPLLNRILAGKNLAPPWFEQAIERAYTRNQSRNIILLNDIKTILDSFQSINIPVILLKGVSLLHDIYPDAGTRPMGDLDILVHKHQLSSALANLQKIGYQFEKIPRTSRSLGFENELMLVRPGALDVYVEVHWSLLDSPYYQQRISGDWLWQSARTFHLDGQPCSVLGLEAQLLHLCAHLFLHHTGRELLWLNDIALLVTKHQNVIEWEVLFSRAQDNNLLIPICEALIILAREWQVAIPQPILARLEQLQPTHQEQIVFARLTSQDRGVAGRFWDDIRSISSWRMRLLFAWDNLFPSPAYMQDRYRIPHPILLPFYYLYRWMIGLRSAV